MSTGAAVSRLSEDEERIERMRRTFDQTFAAPAVLEAGTLQRLLAIQVGGTPFFLQSEQIAGLCRAKPIVPLPSRIPEMLGIAGIRGTLVPVFNLAAFLGLESHAARANWLALVKVETTIAFAFDEFEAQLEIAAEAIYREHDAVRLQQTRWLARTERGVRSLVDMPPIVELIQTRAGLAGPARSS
jgi:purine-binding chemotaxis protein CheW